MKSLASELGLKLLKVSPPSKKIDFRKQRLTLGNSFYFKILGIERVHDGHVGGPKQYNDFPLGNIFYFYANIFYCFSPPTWPPCTHSIV